MISKHKYIDGTLYLYFEYNYEFGNFEIVKKTESYLEIIKDYIKKINYKGSKIVIMVGSILIATLSLSGDAITLDNSKLLNTNNEIVIEEKSEYTLEDLEDTPVNSIIEDISSENILSEDKNISNSNNQEIIKTGNENQVSVENKAQDIVPKIAETKEEKVIEEKNITVENKLENPIKLLHKGNIIEIELEDYVIGVVAAEMPAAFNIEALKAQSTIARTYALNLINQGRTLTDNESTQSYIDINEMKIKWGNDFDKYYNKIVNAVNSTKGSTIKYNGRYIDCVYHSTSNGYTEDSKNVWGNNIPYLKSVESPWDKNATTYQRDTTIDLNTFNNKLGVSIFSIDEIEILERNISNRVSSIKIGNKVLTGIEFRNILGLRSSDFDIDLVDNNVIIITRGYGHGVGMSQYGANGMANSGYNYIDILKHYYTNVEIN